jgi:NAD(P)-dependent dehydrogenase (short-subunit alcohol dehydrogenase family)
MASITSTSSASPLNNRLFDGDGRAVLVAGADGGVGRAVVTLLAACGASVLAVDLHGAEGHDGPVLRRRCDLTDEAQVAALPALAQAAFGRLDHVVHCAGAVGRGPLAQMSLEAWREGLAVNLDSAFLLARACHEALVRARGSLVLMSSPNGVHGGTGLSGPAYAAAKAGVLNLSRYLAKEWAPDVRVNCVVPGTVDTPMLRRLSADDLAAIVASIPLGRLTGAEDVAATVAFLCSDHARSMTGAVMNVSGGRLLG